MLAPDCVCCMCPVCVHGHACLCPHPACNIHTCLGPQTSLGLYCGA